MGMAVNNTIAVIDAMVGKKSEFLRTPKYGIIKNTDDWREKAYNLPFSKTTLLELFFGIYGIMAIFHCNLFKRSYMDSHYRPADNGIPVHCLLELLAYKI